MTGIKVVESTVRFTALRYDFLSSLRRDLLHAGCSASISKERSTMHFRATLKKPSADEARDFLNQQAQHRLRENRSFVARLLKEGIEEEFVSGAALDFPSIVPIVQCCQTERDFALFRFCCLMQTVPTPHLSFRRMIFLVRDSGHPKHPLMGVFALSSPGYSISCRDDFLGWKKQGVKLRSKFLNSCMQLSVCMAVPPYSFIRAGRLVSSCVFTDVVADEFDCRYGHEPPLLGVTTSAAGLHAPIFNRIMLRPGGLYQRIGTTAGYSTTHFGSRTMIAAKRLVVAKDGYNVRIVNHPIRMLKRALNLCNLSREPFVQLGAAKGVYLGASESSAIQILRGEIPTRRVRSFTENDISIWWQKDLEKAIKREDMVSTLRQFTPSDFYELVRE